MTFSAKYPEVWANLQRVFPYFTRPDDLLEDIENYKSLLAAWLYPAVSLEKRMYTRVALCHLLPLMENTSADEPQDPVDEEPPPTFPFAVAMLRFWAILISPDFRAVVQALLDDDLSSLAPFASTEPLPESKREDSLRAAAFCIVSNLYSAHEAINRLEGTAPVKFISRHEMTGIVDQWKNPAPMEPYYDAAFSHLLVRINPSHDVESIVSAVRDIVTKHHEDLSKDHNNNWNCEERKLLGEDYISAMDPVKEFTVKDHGSKSRGEQIFIDNAFHSLIVYELRQTMQPVDIERRFFGMTEKNYYQRMRDNNRRNAFADHLINNALAGLPLQTKILDGGCLREFLGPK